MTIGPAPMCVDCKRMRPDGTCEAYPHGIPEEIIMNRWDHRFPKPGDHGLQFDPKPEATPQEWWPDERIGNLGMIPPAVNHDDLNSKQRETFNFHTVAALLARRGYDCFRLHDDWHGADFIAVHIDGHSCRVQLKSRLSIAEKYSRKGLDVAFPIKGSLWYLVPPDTLVELVSRHAPKWLESDSWLKDEAYHSVAPSAALIEALAPSALDLR